jgi:DNA-binding MarR family transcriptional regulator
METELLESTIKQFIKHYLDVSKALYQKMNLPELTQKQFQYLRAVGEKEAMTMGDLADHFNLSKPSVTDMVNKFEDAGLLNRIKCQEDARIYHLELTKLGETMAKTNELETKALAVEIKNKLSEDEIHTLIQLLGKVGTV